MWELKIISIFAANKWGAFILNILQLTLAGNKLGKFCLQHFEQLIFSFEVEYITYPARKTSKPWWVNHAAHYQASVVHENVNS